MITPQNLVRHEFIGLKVKICSPEKSEISGKVVDETRNMLVVEVEKSVKRFPKEGNVFRFYLPQAKKWVIVDGKIIISRPEDRIKKKYLKW